MTDARRSAGFTLLEILVVLVIIGVMVSMMVLSFGDNRAETVEHEAQRLQGLLRLAADEAIISGQPLGFAVESHGYRFYTLARRSGPVTWRPLAGDRTFDTRETPDFVNFELALDDVREAIIDTGDETDERPQAVLYPTGEITPFEVFLRGDEPRPYWRLEGRLNGEISLQRKD